MIAVMTSVKCYDANSCAYIGCRPLGGQYTV